METRKNKNGTRYREMILVNGKAIKSPFFLRKSDAKSWKANQIAIRERIKLHGEDAHKLNTKITLLDYGNSWLEKRVKVKNTLRTYKNYKSTLEHHFFPNLGSKLLKDISTEDLNNLCMKLKKKGNNNKGIDNILGVLRALLKDAMLENLIVNSPFSKFKNLSKEQKDYKFWSKPQMQRFLTVNQEEELYSFYFCALYTGMRLGELAGLCWDRVDLNSNVICVSRTRDRYELKETTKNKLIRYVPIHPRVKEVLQASMVNKSHERFVFAHENGEPIRVHHVYRYFSQAQERANIERKIRFHDLRHTFASHFMMNGGSIFDLQKVLGHTDIKMTQRYAHHSPEHLQNSLKFFGFGDEKQESGKVLTLI
jgi:integrase